MSGLPLFVAPRGRSFASFEAESRSHGWPSFRDEEVIWDNVRCLPDGEAVSLAGTHLGHNLPDRKGNRYCACTRVRARLFLRATAARACVRALTRAMLIPVQASTWCPWRATRLSERRAVRGVRGDGKTRARNGCGRLEA